MTITTHRGIITCGLLLLAMLLTTKSMALQVKDFTFSHLGKAEGMSNLRVFSILQSPSGAIWWTSATGVGRYNGSKVRNYSLDKNTPFAHLGGRFIHLTADSIQIYAFDNRGSIYVFNAMCDRFDPYFSIAKAIGHDVALNDIHISGDTFFLALHDGVYTLVGNSLKQIISDIYVNRIVPMKDGLLFCAREGVYTESGKSLFSYNAESGYYDELSGKLWLGGYEDGLHIITFRHDGSIASDKFTGFTGGATRGNPIRSICPYDDETMLIGIDGEGVWQMPRNGEGKCVLLFDANETKHGVLHGNGVYSVAVDNWKNIVIGSYSGGIDIARPIGSTTAIYRHVANEQQSLSNDHVNTVIPLSEEYVLMGTDNGISILNFKTGLWQHCCQGTVVLNASQKPDGGVLVSTYGKGIYEIDRNANVTHIYTTSSSLLTDDHVYTTLYDKDGGLWVGSLNGDLLYKPNHPSATTNYYYPIHDVQSITQLASGQIAVGTAFGLKLITPGSEDIKELNYAPSEITDVNPFVNHLLTVGLELWIATDGGGIYIYHLAKHESIQITTANGLPSNYVRSLVKGKDGRIWIATDEGLAFAKSDSPRNVINVNYCYGLNREYSRGAAQNLPGGDIVFGTTTGAVTIHPENVQSLNYTAKIVILGISCDEDQESLQSNRFFSLLEDGEIRLSYRQSTFDLLFESVNMRNHFDIAYRYQIGDGEWSQPTDQQYIRFVNVAPGEHQLTLQCISRTSGAIIDTKTLTIIIAQPWWNSWWMRCLYIIFIIFLFYGAWWIYQLHEKYMRLTIGQLQAVKPAILTTSASLDSDTQGQTTEEEDGGKEFVDKATQLIVEHLSESDFNIDQLCREMAMSRTLFYVKLKSFTGKSPQDFIRIIRLERAASMLRNGYNVTDAAALTGFDNPKYFSTVFKKYFDVSPSKYQK